MTTAPETSKAVSNWLIVVAIMVIAMILVGGATRLTDSGLSITEWRPVTGVVPPLTHEGWLDEFEKYRSSPEYQLQNAGMTLGEFEFIYWWEWGHRFLGRMIGLVFALPLFVFWVRGMIPAGMKPKLLGLLALGGLQGFVGWWMVASGLVDRVDVSQYRLAAHLSLAFVILGVTLWLALSARFGTAPGKTGRLTPLALAFWAAVMVQIALGAFVAGLDAGRIYTTWPGMEGRIIPDGYLAGLPWYQAIFESHAAVQMHHRWMGYLVGLFAFVVAFAFWRSSDRTLKGLSHAIAAMVVIQIALGIVTLVHAAPLSLSLIHQLGAVVLFLLAGSAAWRARRAA
ncbi:MULTISPECIES: COX15/CtaA family protein [Hyphobacterium]|uniref:Heme A synthase n=1 Tax=Hyphobacterium vulgare TaxID=1736751 RepID=A0ABV6ZTF3_9PROT